MFVKGVVNRGLLWGLSFARVAVFWECLGQPLELLRVSLNAFGVVYTVFRDGSLLFLLRDVCACVTGGRACHGAPALGDATGYWTHLLACHSSTCLGVSSALGLGGCKRAIL